MNWKPKLATRILLGYLVPCLVFSLAVVLVYVKVLQLKADIADAERAVTIVEEIVEMQLHVSELQRSARGAMLQPADSRYADYEEARREVERLLVTIQSKVRDPAQLATLERVRASAQAIAETTRKQLELVKAGQQAQAVADFQAGHSGRLYDDYSKLADQFYDREKQIEGQFRARIVDEVAALLQIVATSLVIAVLVSLAAGALLARRTGQSLKELMSVLAASSTQIAATTEQHQGAMTQQASAVTETTATVEEMVATARVNAEQAESASRAASETQDTTRQGLELVTHNASDMATMEGTMNRIAQQIIGLSEQAGQIGEIARVVGELAAETNMLALNAAVEAARAGDQGKGFAVVASEIRKLADQSKKSAERANQIVADIQRATNGMVMTAEDGSKTTHAAADSARQASDAFAKVLLLADAVYQNAQQVLLNSKQQAVALSQIDIAMKNINNGAREMTTGTTQIRQGMARLSDVAGELNHLL